MVHSVNRPLDDAGVASLTFIRSKMQTNYDSGIYIYIHTVTLSSYEFLAYVFLCVVWCVDAAILFSGELNHSTLALGRASAIQAVTRSASSSDDISKGILPYGGHPLPTSQTNLTVCFTNQDLFVSSQTLSFQILE